LAQLRKRGTGYCAPGRRDAANEHRTNKHEFRLFERARNTSRVSRRSCCTQRPRPDHHCSSGTAGWGPPGLQSARAMQSACLVQVQVGAARRERLILRKLSVRRGAKGSPPHRSMIARMRDSERGIAIAALLVRLGQTLKLRCGTG